MTDTTTLRRLAEAATRGPLPVSEVEAYMDAAHPAAVLALLDEVERLRAEVAEWEKLRDPATLHANLLRGVPAALTRRQIVHLVGDDDHLLGELERLRTVLGNIAYFDPYEPAGPAAAAARVALGERG